MPRHFDVEADGGSRGNPGPAGYGAVLREQGTVLAELSESIGTATNNVAEYRGLIAGLRAAAERDPTAAVTVRMDSKLVVEQMSGRWKIKHPDLIPLAREARTFAGRLARVDYQWIPRARNAHADRLANEAMDAAAGAARPSAPKPAAEPAPKPAANPAGTATGWNPATTRATRLLALRHGATALSAERRFSGTRDVPLTDLGRDQAKAAARALAEEPVAVILSSPLARARQTARHVAEATGARVETVAEFAEVDFGEWEGLTFAEVRQEWPEHLQRWLDDPAVAPPGGESFAAVEQRVAAARARLLQTHAECTVVVVSHVTPIKTLVRTALLAPPAAMYRMHLDLASLCETHHYADGPEVVHRVNDTAHLRHLVDAAPRDTA